MFTIALIGPDGAGKTTVGQWLERTLPLPVKYVYMGVNLDASNHVLPTTRLLRAWKRWRKVAPEAAGPRDPDGDPEDGRAEGRLRCAAAGFKAGLGLVNRIAEEGFRHAVAWSYQRRGCIVVFDRHFFADYHAYDISGGGRERTLRSRIHGFFLQRVFPKPNLVIYLDAPAEVLLARKGEGTLPLLERRRQDYLRLRDHLSHFVVVDASRSAEVVARDVAARICDFYTLRTGQTVEASDARA